ncbi:hypothetical protein PHMEG_00023922 [Phytophthora megakarya]|uniref:HAT C-terminal dimerisation domain-containing protein n=1 Tax=Phytophthora megakarya TaxID=4795 RepID=A0A225VF81_9STRA|nr:hypothetical protein PHMEG_00023922 [Phytophthora megakarya]
MIDAVLDLYRRLMAFLVSDNRSTTRAVATRMGMPLDGCARHSFNIAILCIPLRYDNKAVDLALFTKYKPLKGNAKCWSSTYLMLVRPLRHTVAAAIEVLFRVLVTKLDTLASVCIKLQTEEGNLATSLRRCYFLRSTQRQHTTSEPLLISFNLLSLIGISSSCYRTVRQPQKKNRPLLASLVQLNPLYKLRRKPTLRQPKRPRRAAETKYIDLLRMIPPSSNRCECLFSQCKLVLSPLHFSLLSTNSEMLVFLRANRER